MVWGYTWFFILKEEEKKKKKSRVVLRQVQYMDGSNMAHMENKDRITKFILGG